MSVSVFLFLCVCVWCLFCLFVVVLCVCVCVCVCGVCRFLFRVCVLKGGGEVLLLWFCLFVVFLTQAQSVWFLLRALVCVAYHHSKQSSAEKLNMKSAMLLKAEASFLISSICWNKICFEGSSFRP